MKKRMICGLTLLCMLVPGLAFSSSAITRPVEDYTWAGPTGDPLPFESFQDAEEFLAASEVARSKTRREGVNKYKKVVLDKDGVWANSIFRWENVIKRPDINRPRPFPSKAVRIQFFPQSLYRLWAEYCLDRGSR